jgi:hypothetical protein
MHPLDVVFWVFFIAVAAFITWSFIQMFVEMLSDRRHMREIKRPARSGNVPIPGGATGGQSGGEAVTSIGESDYGSSISIGEFGSGDSNGGDSGSGDFSGGGGESGGGGSSGGW